MTDGERALRAVLVVLLVCAEAGWFMLGRVDVEPTRAHFVHPEIPHQVALWRTGR